MRYVFFQNNRGCMQHSRSVKEYQSQIMASSVAAPPTIQRRRQPSQPGTKRWVSPGPSRVAHSDWGLAAVGEGRLLLHQKQTHAQGGRDKGFAKFE